MDGPLPGVDSDYAESSESEWVDVLENGEVWKKVVIKGTNQRPESGQLVEFQVDKVAIKCPLGKGFLPDVLEVVLLMMQVGEECAVKCSSDRFRLKPFAVDGQMVHSAEKFNVVLDRAHEEEDYGEFVDSATQRAKDLFHENDLDKAKQLFKFAADYASDDLARTLLVANECACLQKVGRDATSSMVEPEQSALTELLQQKDWAELLKRSSSVQIPPNIEQKTRAKLVFRRGLAEFHLRKFTEAKSTLSQALEYEPTNKYIESFLQAAVQNEKLENEKLVKFYKGMISELGKPTPTPSNKRMIFVIAVTCVLIVFVGVIIALYQQ